jgi:hypothetical protein
MDDRTNKIIKLIQRIKQLAQQYYELTGRPLGITGEVAEYEAARLLGLKLAEVRQAGYDALEETTHGVRKVQIKGRRLPINPKAGQRIGSIRLDKEWDTVILVLMGLDYEVIEIWEADRQSVETAIKAPGSKARNERGALAVSKFKSIGRLRWQR